MFKLFRVFIICVLFFISLSEQQYYGGNYASDYYQDFDNIPESHQENTEAVASQAGVEFDNTSYDTYAQMDPDDDMQSTEPPEPRLECTGVQLGKVLVNYKHLVISSFRSTNAFLCCEACGYNDQCKAWTRDRDTRLCQLVSTKTPLNMQSSHRYDSGGSLVDMSEGDKSKDNKPRSTQRSSKCKINNRVSYEGGQMIHRAVVNSASECCIVCVTSTDCQSWYYESATGQCVHNGNIPPLKTVASSKGGTAYD